MLLGTKVDRSIQFESYQMNRLIYILRSFFHGFRSYPADVFSQQKNLIKALFSALWAPISPLLSPLAFLLLRALHKFAPRFWQWLLKSDFMRNLLSVHAVRKYGNITKPRPHPFSMHAKYPSWTGLTNREFTGRHLAPAEAKETKAIRPTERELENLFMRPVAQGAQVDCRRSNLLFAAFAQWFTDSFLRTSHKLDFSGPGGNAVVDADGTKKRLPGRHRENNSNHEIDLCQIYGMNQSATDKLRYRDSDSDYDPAKHKGKLRFQTIDDEIYPDKLLNHRPEFPKNAGAPNPHSKLSINQQFEGVHESERLLRSIFISAVNNENGYETLFACGLEHGNSTIGNSLFNTIFLRYHNYVAERIAATNTKFENDEVFEKTRNVMIVLLLKIVICDYVRHISPLNLPFTVALKAGNGQNWVRRNRIHIEFNLLYRWHSLIPDVFPFLPAQEDLKENFARIRHNNQWLIDNGVAQTLQDFTQTSAGKMTLGNTPQQLRMVKRDTLKLMRASNLASYNCYRDRFGLHKVTSFEEVTGEKVMAAALSDLYGGKIDDLEFYVGMVAERHQSGGIMGDLMFNMVAHDALTHAMTNPLLAEEIHVKYPGYEEPGEHAFSNAGVEIIKKVETLDDLLRSVVKDLPASPIGFRKPGA